MVICGKTADTNFYSNRGTISVCISDTLWYGTKAEFSDGSHWIGLMEIHPTFFLNHTPLF